MSEVFAEAGWTNDMLKPIQGQVRVLFRTVQKKMNLESEKQKRPVFKEVIHITKIPADQFLRIDRPIRESDKEEFAAEWQQWERTHENRPIGIPLDMWPQLSDTQKAEFKAMQIVTVEQFAALPDAFGLNIRGFTELREKAKAFVAVGKDAEIIGKIRAEAADRETALQKQIDEMRAMIEAMTKPESEKAKK